MTLNPYERFRGEKLGMTDYLAIDRTELANERTLLAYVRTAIALLITGGSAMKFFEARWIAIAGAGFVLASFLVALIGWWRFRSVKGRMAAALDERHGATTDAGGAG
jgi:putative membrane protein